jgi:uncharacterized membrane protein
MNPKRAIKHLFTPGWVVRRTLGPDALQRIEAAIVASEKRHRGEIRFAVEGALDFAPVVYGMTPRERALQVFSHLHVWDTEENTGVLLYVLIADRDIEIVADRGIAHRIAQTEWDAICRRMEATFRAGFYEQGVLAGIDEVSELLARHFPPGTDNADELPDAPVVL